MLNLHINRSISFPLYSSVLRTINCWKNRHIIHINLIIVVNVCDSQAGSVRGVANVCVSECWRIEMIHYDLIKNFSMIFVKYVLWSKSWRCTESRIPQRYAITDCIIWGENITDHIFASIWMRNIPETPGILQDATHSHIYGCGKSMIYI